MLYFIYPKSYLCYLLMWTSSRLAKSSVVRAMYNVFVQLIYGIWQIYNNKY